MSGREKGGYSLLVGSGTDATTATSDGPDRVKKKREVEQQQQQEKNTDMFCY